MMGGRRHIVNDCVGQCHERLFALLAFWEVGLDIPRTRQRLLMSTIYIVSYPNLRGLGLGIVPSLSDAIILSEMKHAG